MADELPIFDALPTLRDALRLGTSAVLVAPPGAGKTTVAPLALLDEPWLAGKRIVMLEPRRLATRAAARRMADSLGEAVGATVGYRIRMDTKVGPSTRVEVQLFIDDRFAGDSMADQYRPDVHQAKRAPDDWHGFAFATPQLSNGDHQARVYAVHTNGGGARRTLQLIGKPYRFRIGQ